MGSSRHATTRPRRSAAAWIEGARWLEWGGDRPDASRPEAGPAWPGGRIGQRKDQRRTAPGALVGKGGRQLGQTTTAVTRADSGGSNLSATSCWPLPVASAAGPPRAASSLVGGLQAARRGRPCRGTPSPERSLCACGEAEPKGRVVVGTAAPVCQAFGLGGSGGARAPRRPLGRAAVSASAAAARIPPRAAWPAMSAATPSGRLAGTRLAPTPTRGVRSCQTGAWGGARAAAGWLGGNHPRIGSPRCPSPLPPYPFNVPSRSPESLSRTAFFFLAPPPRHASSNPLWRHRRHRCPAGVVGGALRQSACHGGTVPPSPAAA